MHLNERHVVSTSMFISFLHFIVIMIFDTYRMHFVIFGLSGVLLEQSMRTCLNLATLLLMQKKNLLLSFLWIYALYCLEGHDNVQKVQICAYACFKNEIDLQMMLMILMKILGYLDPILYSTSQVKSKTAIGYSFMSISHFFLGIDFERPYILQVYIIVNLLFHFFYGHLHMPYSALVVQNLPNLWKINNCYIQFLHSTTCHILPQMSHVDHAIVIIHHISSLNISTDPAMIIKLHENFAETRTNTHNRGR
ncbi:hypothetical protein ACJX0J_016929 [Zea mays]